MSKLYFKYFKQTHHSWLRTKSFYWRKLISLAGQTLSEPISPNKFDKNYPKQQQ